MFLEIYSTVCGGNSRGNVVVQEGQDTTVIRPLIAIVIDALQEQNIQTNEELSLYLISSFRTLHSFEIEEDTSG